MSFTCKLDVLLVRHLDVCMMINAAPSDQLPRRDAGYVGLAGGGWPGRGTLDDAVCH